MRYLIFYQYVTAIQIIDKVPRERLQIIMVILSEQLVSWNIIHKKKSIQIILI